MLLDEESQHLAGLSDFIGKPISLQAEPRDGAGAVRHRAALTPAQAEGRGAVALSKRSK